MLELHGTEAVTIELGGTIAPATLAPLLAASGLPAELQPGGARVSLLVLRMQALHLRGLPWPAFHYGEALWRIAVRYNEQSAWLAVVCDLDSPWIRFSGARLVRYPVRRARFQFMDCEAAIGASVDSVAGGLELCATAGLTEPPPAPPRPLFVHSGGRLYRVPWREEPAPYRRVATVEAPSGALAEATFRGKVSWDATGLVHRGRLHRCGLARRERG